MYSIDSIEHDLSLIFCDDWSVHRGTNTITLSRDISIGKESIKVSKHEDDDFWYVTVKYMDRENEIYSPISINAHNTTKLTHSEALKIKNNCYDELERIGNMKTQKLGRISFGTIVESEHCPINEPHNHRYVTDFVSLKTDDYFHEVLPFLSMRNAFFRCD